MFKVPYAIMIELERIKVLLDVISLNMKTLKALHNICCKDITYILAFTCYP